MMPAPQEIIVYHTVRNHSSLPACF